MVVARVYLIMLVPVRIPIVLVILLLAVNIVAQIDVKKNIAYSTSIHLVLIVLFSITRIYSAVVIYIILHRIVKGQLFQSSRYEIHRVRSQDIRKFNMNGSSMLMLIAMFMLSALVRMVIIGSKELVVLGMISVVVLFMVVVSMMYTLVYASKLSVVGKFGESEGFYVIFIMLLSMVLVEVNFRVWMSLLIFRIVIGVFYGNSIITVL
jgi:NADH:ubiquinone oxidoreductase subunit 5 (subunit L)/multisubunit Na+/H+ antiporter MnhA subunit